MIIIPKKDNIFLSFASRQLVYSDDEEVICKNFTRDFYKLVNIHKSESLQSQLNSDEKIAYLTSDDESNTSSSGHCHENGHDDSCDDSPTPSEAGRAQVFSCSSTTTSESGDSFSVQIKNLSNNVGSVTKGAAEEIEQVVIDAKKYNVLDTVVSAKTASGHAESSDEDVVVVRRSNSTNSSCNNKMNVGDGNSPMSRRKVRNSSSSCRKIVKEAKVQPCMSWRRSNGWTRVSGQSKVKFSFFLF